VIVIAWAAQAAQTNWPAVKLPEQAADKAKSVIVEKFKIVEEKKADKGAKTERREFPLMFDIADKAQRHKAEKAKEKGDAK